MEQSQAKVVIAAHIKEQFGKLLELRQVSIVHRAAGRFWSGELYCVTRNGDVRLGTIEVDDNEAITKDIAADDLIDMLAAIKPTAGSPFDRPQDDFGGSLDEFSDWVVDDSERPSSVAKSDSLAPISGFFNELDPSQIQAQINSLIATGDPTRLKEARCLLPRLLTEPEGRGNVLRQMAEIEMLLDEFDLAVNYLEAAAREFSDLADLDSLGHIAELSLQLLGDEAFAGSPVKTLLDRARARMRPVNKLDHSKLFRGLRTEDLFLLEGMAEEVTLRMGEDVLREGEAAVNAYIVKSGLLSIRLESRGGRTKVIRTCFPGDFIGESSVVGGEGATCTATVRAETITSLWRFNGARLKELGGEVPVIKERVESAQTLHQLDSFISMHEATAALDVHVRDNVLGCVNGMRRATAGEILDHAGKTPSAVYLIAKGELEYRLPGGAGRVLGADAFAGLRDTLHGLPLEGDLVALSDCLLVTFSPESLKTLASEASPEVVSTLERLG